MAARKVSFNKVSGFLSIQPNGASPREIADHFGYSRDAAKQALKFLYESGKVFRTDGGVYYVKTAKEKKKYTEVLPSVNDFDYTSGYKKERRDIVIKGKHRVLFISDIHIPQHSPYVKTAIDYGLSKDVDIVILGGDIMDCHTISTHTQDPLMPTIVDEINLTKRFLDSLRKLFPKARIIYMRGNHEERIPRWLNIHAKEFSQFAGLDFGNLLELKNNKIELLDSFAKIILGKLNIIHAHEIRGGGSLNVARAILLKTMENILFGHFHRTQEYIHKTIGGQIFGAWAVGCLCDDSPDYLPINNWNHGFAYIETNEDGTFNVENKKIYGGTVL